MALKLIQQFQSSKLRYVPSYFTHFISSHSSPTSTPSEVDTVFQILNNSPSSQTIKDTLQSSGVHLSNPLVDHVLKRARFTHCNPLRALDFYHFASESKHFYHSPFALDTMLYILGRNRHFDKIWILLHQTSKKDRTLITPRTLQVVLGRVAKVCSVRHTVDWFKRFRRLVSEFDTHCFNALLRSLAQEKSMSDARNVYHSLKHEFRPNLQTFNVLLSGWKSSEEAEGFFREMKEMGVKPDIVSYNSVIDVYCKNREIDKAYKVFAEMQEVDGMGPDVITFTSLIGGLGLVGQPDKAQEVLVEMREYGCQPDVAAYNAVIRNFCIAKRLGDANQLMDEMGRLGLNPNPTTYNLFFRVYYWSNDLNSSWSLYLKMMGAGCLPNTQSCMFLIRLFRRHEKVDMAVRLWDDMVDKGFGSYALVSDVLFGLLCDLGKLVEAERCFLQMVDKGQKPSNVSYRRIRVLMELANRRDALNNLAEKMAGFGMQGRIRRPGEDFDDETSIGLISRRG